MEKGFPHAWGVGWGEANARNREAAGGTAHRLLSIQQDPESFLLPCLWGHPHFKYQGYPLLICLWYCSLHCEMVLKTPPGGLFFSNRNRWFFRLHFGGLGCVTPY